MSHQIINYLRFLLQKKNFQLVEEESLKFLNTNPSNSEILNILGISKLGLNNIDESIDCFKKALKINNYNNYKLNLALAYLKNNKKISAIKIFLRIFREKYFDYDLFKYLYLFSKNNKNKKKVFDRILIILKEDSNFKFSINTVNFINFFIQKEELDFIQEFCEQILKKKEIPLMHNVLGNIYFLNDHYELAEKCYLNAIKLDPSNYSFYFDLGEFYKSKGFANESLNNYHRAIELNQEKIDGNLHRCFSLTKKYKDESDLHFQFLKSTLQNKSDISELNKMHLLFAISKANDELGNFKEAHKNFEEANMLAKKINPYDMLNLKSEFNIFQKVFSEIDIKQFMKFGYQSNLYKPIFILGLPRSGSTLVDQIISTHSKVFSNGESKVFGRNLSLFFNTYEFIKFEKDLLKIFKDKKIIEKIGRIYIENSIKKKNKSIFTDKMLFNFLYIGLIKICLPHSKIIVCQRDYRDIFVSLIKNYFTEIKMGFAYSEEQILEFILFYDRVLQFWKKKLTNLLFFTEYESLIKDPNTQVRQILNYCDLPWEEDCLNFDKNKNFVKTLSNTQVRSGIYQSSLQNWKNYDEFYSQSFSKLNSLQISQDSKKI